MGTKFDIKKWLLASAAVFVLFSLLEFVFQRALLIQAFPEFFPEISEGRDTTMLRLYTYIGRACFALLFVLIFLKGLEGKSGLGEGARYGLWIGLLIQVPAFFGNLVVTDFSIGALTARAVVGTIEIVLCGVAANWFYLKKSAA